jgi:GH43 family beta-xylosidase
MDRRRKRVRLSAPELDWEMHGDLKTPITRRM